ncbi:MFS transporter [Streptomyces sp. WAC05374]|uniref:MFS transporter n=1 Tax=Streptomyces sp. WAC05374 TaxID=2487420 RepID=UPI00105466B2|nr:MFS transporter [Streptomyces sp. WAC05374]TDF40387.1 MFS transporter [Streptomyces sp. WAC05374]TDF49021.1 MFS transporter [Streptomyces sp. WAC05374]TDF49506.1 MFS transporter [Streptomyces sp. WAC05374]
MTDARLRRGRGSLAVCFFVQGVTFALLVTRIPAIQDRCGISDSLLPAFLAAVPVLAGVGSVAAGKLVRRVAPSAVLRWAQPVVLLALLGVGAGERMWHVAVALSVFGLAVGALDASMNMLGVSLQHAYGRSIMLGFHAAYSLGGIVGASLAWVAVHRDVALGVSYLAVVVVVLPAALVGSRWYVDGGRGGGEGPAGGRAAGVLVPLCLVMTFAYIGDSTVSNWSAKYLTDVLGGSEALATVPYNAYMVTTLLGRAVGDLGVRRFGAVAVVRGGAVLAAAGFGVVAGAPGPGAGVAGFTLLGVGLSVLVPQTFAAARGDAEVARLNVFNYVGFLVGSPLVGALGDAWSYRGAMLVPLVLVLVTLRYARSFGVERDRYGGGHERPRTVDVG